MPNITFPKPWNLFLHVAIGLKWNVMQSRDRRSDLTSPPQPLLHPLKCRGEAGILPQSATAVRKKTARRHWVLFTAQPTETQRASSQVAQRKLVLLKKCDTSNAAGRQSSHREESERPGSEVGDTCMPGFVFHLPVSSLSGYFLGAGPAARCSELTTT